MEQWYSVDRCSKLRVKIRECKDCGCKRGSRGSRGTCHSDLGVFGVTRYESLRDKSRNGLEKRDLASRDLNLVEKSDQMKLKG